MDVLPWGQWENNNKQATNAYHKYETLNIPQRNSIDRYSTIWVVHSCLDTPTRLYGLYHYARFGNGNPHVGADIFT